jgi:hypothetical protein
VRERRPFRLPVGWTDTGPRKRSRPIHRRCLGRGRAWVRERTLATRRNPRW